MLQTKYKRKFLLSLSNERANDALVVIIELVRFLRLCLALQNGELTVWDVNCATVRAVGFEFYVVSQQKQLAGIQVHLVEYVAVVELDSFDCVLLLVELAVCTIKFALSRFMR
ncbi:Hypothetical_protein [Hexamita inflata]|uniref:Hypothetical_protein n=1 Tax=Hexamita inflata TaxID=28002 RepID=A0ABP1HMY8_9EUKA